MLQNNPVCAPAKTGFKRKEVIGEVFGTAGSNGYPKEK
jgi:hypothetical protein